MVDEKERQGDRTKEGQRNKFEDTRQTPSPTDSNGKAPSETKSPPGTDLPDCLNFSECKGRYLLKDHPLSTAAKKKVLLKEYHEQKTARGSLSKISFSTLPPPELAEGRL